MTWDVEKDSELESFDLGLEPKIFWDSAQLAKHGMAIDALRDAVKELTHPTDPSQWCL